VASKQNLGCIRASLRCITIVRKMCRLQGKQRTWKGLGRSWRKSWANCVSSFCTLSQWTRNALLSLEGGVALTDAWSSFCSSFFFRQQLRFRSEGKRAHLQHRQAPC
jgi:hypothetical protein